MERMCACGELRRGWSGVALVVVEGEGGPDGGPSQAGDHPAAPQPAHSSRAGPSRSVGRSCWAWSGIVNAQLLTRRASAGGSARLATHNPSLPRRPTPPRPDPSAAHQHLCTVSRAGARPTSVHRARPHRQLLLLCTIPPRHIHPRPHSRSLSLLHASIALSTLPWALTFVSSLPSPHCLAPRPASSRPVTSLHHDALRQTRLRFLRHNAALHSRKNTQIQNGRAFSAVLAYRLPCGRASTA